jgi:hypothetical protein
LTASSSALRLHAGFLEQAAALALVLGQGQQEHLRGDELVAGLLRFLVGDIEQVGQVAADADFAAVAFDLGQALQRLRQRRLQPADIGAGALQQRGGAAVVLVEQGQQQVLRLDELLVVAHGQALGIGKRLLELGGEVCRSAWHQPQEIIIGLNMVIPRRNSIPG